MSVINDMLRDLNQRRAPEVAGERATVPQSLIEPQKNMLKTLLVVLIFVLCVAAVTGYWFVYIKDSMASGKERGAQKVESQSAMPDKHALQDQNIMQVQSPVEVHPQSSVPENAAMSDVALEQNEDGRLTLADPIQVSSSASLQEKKTVAVTDNTVVVSQPESMANTQLATAKPQSGKSLSDVQVETVIIKPVETLPRVTVEATADKEPKLASLSEDTPERKPSKESKERQTNMQVSLSPLARDQQMAERALKLINTGFAEQAYRELVDFLEEHQVDDESRAVLANYLLQENRLAEAGDVLLNAPIHNSASLRQLKARWYAAQGDDKMALYTLNSVLPDIKQYPGYYVLLAAYYQRFGWHKEALKTYTALVEYDDSVADWWAGLALAADRTRDFKQAALAYEMALELPGLTPELNRFVQSRIKQLRVVQ